MNQLLSVLEKAETSAHILGVALFAFLFVRARTTGQARRRSDGWLLGRVALTVTAILFLVAGLNYLVNPLGIYSPRLFEPLVLHSRAEKMRMYRTAQPPPEIVVLGSSTSFTMPPAYIRERTGRPAFNASLHGGVPEDYLAFLRYIASIGTLPKLLIVPLAVQLVRPNLPTGFEPHDPLRPYLELKSSNMLANVARLFTLDQTRVSLRLLAAEWRGRPPSHYRFDADGLAHFVETGAPLEKIVDSYLATKDWGRSLFDFVDLDKTQMEYFQQFLTLARNLGVKVIVYVPPLYPRALALYERETNLPALNAALLARLRAWQSEGLIVAVYDFTRPESFGGDGREFHDLAHPTAAASRRMLDVILQSRPAGS